MYFPSACRRVYFALFGPRLKLHHTPSPLTHPHSPAIYSAFSLRNVQCICAALHKFSLQICIKSTLTRAIRRQATSFRTDYTECFHLDWLLSWDPFLEWVRGCFGVGWLGNLLQVSTTYQCCNLVYPRLLVSLLLPRNRLKVGRAVMQDIHLTEQYAKLKSEVKLSYAYLRILINSSSFLSWYWTTLSRRLKFALNVI